MAWHLQYEWIVGVYDNALPSPGKEAASLEMYPYWLWGFFSGPFVAVGVQGTTSHSWVQGEQSRAKAHATHSHEVCQEHLMVTELRAELQAIEEKWRVEARCYTLIT